MRWIENSRGLVLPESPAARSNEVFPRHAPNSTITGSIKGVRVRANWNSKFDSFSVSWPGIRRARLIHRQQSGYFCLRSALYEFTSSSSIVAA